MDLQRAGVARCGLRSACSACWSAPWVWSGSLSAS